MMTRKITIMALIAGIVLGGAATEAFNLYRQTQDSYRRARDSQRFQQRVHCKSLADAYLKENTDLRDNSDMGTSVTLDKVGYSPARNSCVAEVKTIDFFKGGALEHDSVQDLLSGETLFSLPCNKDCVEEFQKLRFVDPAFEYVMNNADEPVALGEQYTKLQSDLEHKATPAASSPAAEYDAQGKPIAATKSPEKHYYDPNKGKRIQRPPLDPNTGEPIQAPAPQHK